MLMFSRVCLTGVLVLLTGIVCCFVVLWLDLLCVCLGIMIFAGVCIIDLFYGLVFVCVDLWGCLRLLVCCMDY